MKDTVAEIDQLGHNKPLIKVLQLLDVQLDKLSGETTEERKADVDET